MGIAPRFKRLVMACVVAALLHAGALRAEVWYENYQLGVQAIQSKDWKTAINRLTQAIEQKGDSGAKVRTSGVLFISYFPYHKLGIAYYHDGQYDAALQAFTTEESLGAVSQSASDLKTLIEYKKKSEEGKVAAAAAERERIRSIVAEAIQEARVLEGQGKLDGAIIAVSKALAIDATNPQAMAELDRLRTAAVEAQRGREKVEQARRLTEEARALMASGKYAEASSLLNQSIAVLQTPEADALLRDVREKMRVQIEAQNAEQRRKVITKGLADAQQLQKAGNEADALRVLQQVLAADPGNAAARAMQETLVRKQAEAEQQKTRTDEVTRLIPESEHAFANGNYDEALQSLNRVLMLDPSNVDARSLISRVYGEIRRSALGGVRISIPPIVSLPDLTNEEAVTAQGQKDRWQIVRSPHYQLTGFVFHPAKVTTTFFQDAGVALLSSVVNDQQIGGFWVQSFIQPYELQPGMTALRVHATDSEGRMREVVYRVAYVPPIWRRWWFGLGEAIIALSALALAFLFQKWRLDQRRAQALRDAELSRKTKELDYARRVQLAMIPSAPFRMGDFEAAGRMIPAFEVGGDYFAYFPICGDRFCILIGDATGHGVAAGMVTGMAKSALASLARHADQLIDAAGWLRELNSALEASISERVLGMCMALCLVDPKTDRANVGLAGIPNVFHFVARDGGRLDRLRMGGPALGYIHTIDPPTQDVIMGPGDRLIMFSDGLLEQSDPRGEMWGYEGLEAPLLALCQQDLSCERIAEEMLATCGRFAAGRDADDDQTVLVLYRRP